MSTKRASRGITRSAQKPNMSHLLRVVRRALRRSKSLGAKGFTSAVATAASILRFASFLDPLDDDVGDHIDAAGDDKKHNAEDEQYLVVGVTMDRFTHFG